MGRKSQAEIDEKKLYAKKVPDPPALLNDRAKEIWVAVFNSVPEDFYCEGELPIVQEFCSSCATCEHIQAMLDRGEIEYFIDDPKTGAVKSHPAVKILSSNRAAINTLAMRLKISASARLTRQDVKRSFRENISADKEREDLMFVE